MKCRISALLGAAALLALLLVPAPASALSCAPPGCGIPRYLSVADNPSHRGPGLVNPNYCPPARMCPMIYHGSAIAWRWTGTAWQQTMRATTMHVYVWPYGSGWSWTWTADAGWLAMRSSDLVYVHPGYWTL